MNIHTEIREGIHIARPQGRLDSATVGELDRTLEALFAGAASKLILDFSQVDYISSAGLRSTLIAGKKTRALPGGRLALCGLRPQVAEIFDVSGFKAIFLICPDLAAALVQLA